MVGARARICRVALDRVQAIELGLIAFEPTSAQGMRRIEIGTKNVRRIDPVIRIDYAP